MHILPLYKIIGNSKATTEQRNASVRFFLFLQNSKTLVIKQRCVKGTFKWCLLSKQKFQMNEHPPLVRLEYYCIIGSIFLYLLCCLFIYFGNVLPLSTVAICQDSHQSSRICGKNTSGLELYLGKPNGMYKFPEGFDTTPHGTNEGFTFLLDSFANLYDISLRMETGERPHSSKGAPTHCLYEGEKKNL